MKTTKTLNDIFSSWITDGVFHELSTIYPDQDIFSGIVDAHALDLDYHGNRSGKKEISPLLYKLEETGDYDTAAEYMTAIGAIIKSKFYEDWKRIKAALFAEYNPIENYNSTEVRTGGHTETETPDDFKETTVQTPNNWKTETQGNDTDNVINVNKGVYAFNSEGPSPKETEQTTQKNKQTTEQSGTYTTERSESGSKTRETVYDEETLVRSGNIGVTTSQQMIESELALRKHHFWDIVFKDVDTILTTNTFIKEVKCYD